MTKQQQTVKPELINSEVALIRKGLEMLDAAPLGFEEKVRVILAKLRRGGGGGRLHDGYNEDLP